MIGKYSTMIKFILTLLCVLLISSSLAFAEQAASQPSSAHIRSLKASYQELDVLRQRNHTLDSRLASLYTQVKYTKSELKRRKISQKSLERVDLALGIAQADLAELNLALVDAQQTIISSDASIREFEIQLQGAHFRTVRDAESTDKQIAKVQAELVYLRSLLKIEHERAKILSKGQSIARKVVLQTKDWRSHVEDQVLLLQQQQRENDLENLEAKLHKEQQKWYSTLGMLNSQLKLLGEQTDSNVRAFTNLNMQIFYAQEKNNLLHQRGILARIKNQTDDLAVLSRYAHSINELNIANRRALKVIGDLGELKHLLKKKIGLIKHRDELSQQSKSQNIISDEDFLKHQQYTNELLANTSHQTDTILLSQREVATYQQTLTIALNRALAEHKGLPGLSAQAWQLLGLQLEQMASLTVQSMRTLWSQARQSLMVLSTLQISILAFTAFAWMAFWLWIKDKVTSKAFHLEENDKTFSRHFLFVCFELLKRNLKALMFFLGFTTIMLFSGTPISVFQPIFFVLVIWITVKFIIGFTRLLLVESVRESFGRDVKLYKRLKLTLIGIALFVILTALTQQLPVSYEVEDLFNRLLLLFTLVLSLLLLKAHDLVPRLAAPYLTDRPKYISRLIAILNIVVPLLILTNAVIGIFGYVNLAWTIAKYEGVFVLVFAAYVVLRGLLIELMSFVASYIIGNVRNGWLWSEAILKPIDKVLRIALFVVSWFVLFVLYDWGRESLAVKKLYVFSRSGLFNFAGTQITPLNIIQLYIIISVFYWATKWIREFSFRWLFNRARDLGLRNSLSIFTQYAVVILGIIVTFKVVGIKLSGLAVVLGGLAVGVGFGLREFANNFVSGILLLIERPIKTGDIVTIGGYEGVVKNIGMRSVTVMTWDNMAVVVPNSEIFSKVFTNWTHQDSIIRAVVRIKIHRHDDPHLVQSIIYKILHDLDEIVPSPEPQVFFKEIDEGLLEFEVRYFINLAGDVSRPAARSKVLFAIFERFKAFGIHAPYPQQDIQLTKLPD